MEENKHHFRHIMLFYFRKGENAAETQREICSVYGEDAVDDSTVRKWFRRFRDGNFNLEDEKRSGRPSEIDSHQILALVETDRHKTTREIADNLKINQSTVVRRLRQLGMVSKSDVWVPHELSQRNLINRISACDSLLKRYEIDPFLNRMVTGDEKWIVYNNVKRKRSWSKKDEAPLTTAKAGLHPKKVMLCIWWDYKGIIYYELLPENQTINSDKYCSQLDELKRAIDRKRPELVNRKGIVFQHDNARPHTSLETRRKLIELGWDVLVHPPYSPDLAPSDFHLFRSLQNSLNGKNLTSLEACKNHLDQFFVDKSQKFYERGIMKLPERWQKVIEQNGAYFID